MVSRLWLSNCMVRFLKRKAAGPVFKLTLVEMRRAFMGAAQRVGLARFNPVLYMGRHSGASIDRLEDRLCLLEVKKRGRWRTDASLRRYEKRALVQLVVSKQSESERRLCRNCAAQLGEELLRRCGGP